MLKKIKQWANKPYFLIDKVNIKLYMVLGVGTFTSFFLFTFQPYGIDKVIDANANLIIGYGVLVSLSLFISYFILPKVFSFYFSARSWTIQKEALFLMVTFFIICTSNYFYHTAFVSQYLPEFSYIRFVSVVFSIGIFPVLFIIFMVERYIFKKHKINSNLIIEEINKDVKEFATIPSDNIKEEPFHIDIDLIFYAQSNNNYTTFFYLKDDLIKQKLIRITLKKVSGILESYPQFIRCHRSYLINKKQISKIMGNARTLEVLLNKISEPIPVSRSFPKEELEF